MDRYRRRNFCSMRQIGLQMFCKMWEMVGHRVFEAWVITGPRISVASNITACRTSATLGCSCPRISASQDITGCKSDMGLLQAVELLQHWSSHAPVFLWHQTSHITLVIFPQILLAANFLRSGLFIMVKTNVQC